MIVDVWSYAKDILTVVVIPITFLIGKGILMIYGIGTVREQEHIIISAEKSRPVARPTMIFFFFVNLGAATTSPWVATNF